MGSFQLTSFYDKSFIAWLMVSSIIYVYSIFFSFDEDIAANECEEDIAKYHFEHLFLNQIPQ